MKKLGIDTELLSSEPVTCYVIFSYQTFEEGKKEHCEGYNSVRDGVEDTLVMTDDHDDDFSFQVMDENKRVLYSHLALSDKEKEEALFKELVEEYRKEHGEDGKILDCYEETALKWMFDKVRKIK